MGPPPLLKYGHASTTKKSDNLPKRGEICLADFDSVVGSEIANTCPAPVIQNDMGNRVSPVTIVAALSSSTSTATTEAALRQVLDLDNDASVGVH